MTRRSSKTFAGKSFELACAAPFVIGHRVARMAVAGASPSPLDRAEFALMANEKTTAFASAWQAMGAQVFVASQSLGLSAMRSWTAAASGRPRSLGAASAEWNRAMLGVLDKGLAPIHRTAVANAKRLAKPRSRAR
jgi:hypothetical protein